MGAGSLDLISPNPARGHLLTSAATLLAGSAPITPRVSAFKGPVSRLPAAQASCWFPARRLAMSFLKTVETPSNHAGRYSPGTGDLRRSRSTAAPTHNNAPTIRIWRGCLDPVDLRAQPDAWWLRGLSRLPLWTGVATPYGLGSDHHIFVGNLRRRAEILTLPGCRIRGRAIKPPLLFGAANRDWV